MKLGASITSDLWNLMVMFICPLLDQRCPFRTNWVQKINIVWNQHYLKWHERWNLIPRLILICWIRLWCSNEWKYHFWENFVQKTKLCNSDKTWCLDSQQTFILMKTSWRRLVSLTSGDTFKMSHQDEYVRLTHTCSEDIFKTSSRRFDQYQYTRLGHTSSRRLQYVFKTSSRRLTKTSLTIKCLGGEEGGGQFDPSMSIFKKCIFQREGETLIFCEF